MQSQGNGSQADRISPSLRVKMNTNILEQRGSWVTETAPSKTAAWGCHTTRAGRKRGNPPAGGSKSGMPGNSQQVEGWLREWLRGEIEKTRGQLVQQRSPDLNSCSQGSFYFLCNTFLSVNAGNHFYDWLLTYRLSDSTTFQVQVWGNKKPSCVYQTNSIGINFSDISQTQDEGSGTSLQLLDYATFQAPPLARTGPFQHH